jgi:hypothetical protein
MAIEKYSVHRSLIGLLFLSVLTVALGIATSSTAVPLNTVIVNAPSAAHAHEGSFSTFDAPGAGTGITQGTYPVSVNQAGSVTGYYYDSNFFTHGFVRSPDGTIIVFDPPDATGTFPGSGTYVNAINAPGVITGSYYDADSVAHGFVRARDGTFTTFDLPGALEFSSAGDIDAAGAIAGTYFDSNLVAHGFIRASKGAISTFDASGSFTMADYGLGTQAFTIKPPGAVAGCYTDTNFADHGFIRGNDGTLTTFDGPNATNLGCAFSEYFFGIIPRIGINPGGAITGAYFQPIAGNLFRGNYRGFVRAKDGSFTTFDAVASPSSPCCTWTFGVAINPAGVIAGYDNDFDSVNHVFVRARDGTIRILDAPGAGTGFNQGTVAFSINPAGQVAGQYIDANCVIHGFLWSP